MEAYSDSELEFIRREIKKKYEVQAIEADEVVNDIPEYPKSVGDERFNFLSEYVEKTLHHISKDLKNKIQELLEFNKENYKPNFLLSATLKKLYCEQHYKRPTEERKNSQFKLMSINRFYYYFSGKSRKDFWTEIGASEMSKKLAEIQKEIDDYRLSEGKTEGGKEHNGEGLNDMQNHADSKVYSLDDNKIYYKLCLGVLSVVLIGILGYYYFSLKPQLNNKEQELESYKNKIIRTPASARQVQGLMGTWYSYNRTRETNDENRQHGTIFGRIEWKIDSDKNGNLVFHRPTSINENEGWVEVMNMQVNFFMNVHAKVPENNADENLGFRHFICKPNKIELAKADTLFCVCTSYIHKDGRLDEPLASREILIRKKDGQEYPTNYMVADSVPEKIKALLPKDKSYLKILP